MMDDVMREVEFQKRMDKKQAFNKNPRYSKATEDAQHRVGDCDALPPPTKLIIIIY